LERDPLAEGQHPIGLYVSGGVAVAVAAGLSVRGWPAVGCYTVAGVVGLYGGYVLVLGVGWRLVSGALTRATTRSAQRGAAAVGQRVLELRFRVGADGCEAEGGGVPEIDRIMEDISAALGKEGDCSEAEGTGVDHRLFVRATDVQTGVDAVRRVAVRHSLPPGSYLWIPDLVQPRMGSRHALRAAPTAPLSAPEGHFAGSFRRLRESLSLEIEWMRMPQGQRALSRIHRSNDLVLRHFHEPLDLVDLNLLLGPQAEQLLRFGIREVPPVDRHTDESKLDVWLSMQSSAPAADVMVGSRRLGSTHLPSHAWEALKEEAKRGVFADGLLETAHDHRTGKPVVRRLRCYLPRDKKGRD